MGDLARRRTAAFTALLANTCFVMACTSKADFGQRSDDGRPRGVDAGIAPQADTTTASHDSTPSFDVSDHGATDSGAGHADAHQSCQPTAERCDERDNNCNGEVDEGFDLQSDPLNCGACGIRCGGPHATGACRAGRCDLACDEGYADCDGDPKNGCEASLGQAPHCGACNNQGSCRPRQIQRQTCGLGGTRSRRCGGDCDWGQWSACEGQGVCSPGAGQERPCGRCGTQRRLCGDDYRWQAWGSCSGQGACEAGSRQQRQCGRCAAGLQRRQCDTQCRWGAWSSCDESSCCTPTTCPAQGKNCGRIADGCGVMLNCGSCTGAQTCGGGGEPNVCGCTRTTCQAQGKNCGQIHDGCGRMIDCGTCGRGNLCGGNNLCRIATPRDGPSFVTTHPTGANFLIGTSTRAWVNPVATTQLGRWQLSGHTVLANAAPWRNAAAVGGQRPWQGPGVTAAWREDATVVLVSQNRFWRFRRSASGAWTVTGGWLANWLSSARSVNGRRPWQGAGVTAAWTRTTQRGTSLTLVSGALFWEFARQNGTWLRRREGQLASAPGWTGAPAVAGLRPWQGGGVSSAWYDPHRKVVGIVNQRRYWILYAAGEDPRRWRWVATGNLANQNPLTRVLTLKVLSYNIGRFWPGQRDRRSPYHQLDKLADLVVDNQIDVAGIQETEWGTARNNYADLLQQLRIRLAERDHPMYGRFRYRFDVQNPSGFPPRPTTPGEFGMAVLSRWPLANYAGGSATSLAGGDTGDDVGYQAVDVPTDLGPIRFYNMHPRPGGYACITINDFRTRILSRVANRMTVLAGDFNARPEHGCIRHLLQSYENSCAVVDDDNICSISTVDYEVRPDIPPENRNRGPIDYVFYRRGTRNGFAAPWRAVTSFTDRAINEGLPVSDHRPVISGLVYVAP